MQTAHFKKLVYEAPLLVLMSTVFLILAILIRFAVLPLYTKLLVQQKELNHFQSLISSESGYALIKKDISRKIDILKTKISPQPDEKKVTADLSSYLETLIAVARKADIRFVRMQPQEESRNSDFSLHPVLLALTTTYHELGQFLAALEKLPHLFQVNRLAMSATVSSKCEVKLLVTCLIPLEQ